MLTKIRKSSDSLIVRIILGLIALSFVGIGGASFIGGNSAGDVVSFSNTESISMESFQMARSKEIDTIQRQNGINLTEENIAELGVDISVLRRLINESMINYLAKYYEFDISSEKVIGFVKKTPYFRNQDGEFDLSVFKAAFQNSPAKEEEYLASIKKHLITNSLLSVFMDSFVSPKIMVENMVNYMSETRVADIFFIDLENKPKDYKPENIPTEQLEHFYKENSSLFVVPELRGFGYLKADKKFLEKKMNITNAELKQFFEENKEEFGTNNFTKAKKQVREEMSRERMEELANELARNFEEDVSSGLTLQEIAQKYEIEVSYAEGMSMSEMNSSDIDEYAEISDSVFEMVEGEVSYPIEVQDQNKILLVELKTITPSAQRSFSDVKKDIKSMLEKRELAFENVKIIEEIQKNFDPKLVQKNLLKNKGVTSISNVQFTRGELPLEDKFPPQLLKNIFATSKDNTTPLVSDGKKVYFALLKNVKTDRNKAKKIKENSGDHFSNVIREGVFQELLTHLTQKNQMQLMYNTGDNSDKEL